MARRGCFDPSLANHSEPKSNGRRKRKAPRTAKQKAKAKRDRRMDRIMELRRLPYHEYLLTPHWRQKRETAFRVHGRKCNQCGSCESLQVHHKSYKHKGAERMSELEILCEDCHAGEHQHEKPWITDSLTIEFIGLFGVKGSV